MPLILHLELLWTELRTGLNLSVLWSCRFLPPTPPDLSNLSKIILHAFSLAIVSYFLLGFVGERYASLHNYNIASNQVRTKLHILPRSRSKLNSTCRATNYLTVVEIQGQSEYARWWFCSNLLPFPMESECYKPIMWRPKHGLLWPRHLCIFPVIMMITLTHTHSAATDSGRPLLSWIHETTKAW